MPAPVAARAAAPQKPAVTRKVTAEGPEYTVKSGDSLSVIAHAYGVKTSAIRDANGLTGDKIIVGQKLTIPSPTKTPAEVSAPAAAEAKPVAETKPAADISAPVVDAPKAPADMAAPVTMQPPAAVEKTAPVTSAKPVAGVLKDYTVEEGDDIFSIAMMWGVSVSRIREVNGLKDDELKVGQKIKIPLSE
jgi:N-acetylmuramoyl-L-alanine amidase